MGTSTSYTYILLCFTLLLSVSTSSPTPSLLVLPLTHSLSRTQFTSTHHLLKSTSTRSAAHFLNHHRHPRSQQQQVSLPLSPGSDYTLTLTLNSKPPQPISLFLDTGSNLVWFPCHPFQCVLCDDKLRPNATASAISVSSSANKLHCKSPSCSSAHSNLPSSDLCAISGCPLSDIETSDCSTFTCPPFYYAYGDGSLIATLYSGSVTLYPPLVLPNFTFGCSHSALAEPTGVAGFGRGLLSLPAQLSSLSPQLGTHFSYCLVSHSFDSNRISLPSPLILGRYDKKPENVTTKIHFSYTPLLDNPKHPYLYSVGLEGISVGGRNIPAPEFLKKVDGEGSGAMVVDSGTTFTMLPSAFYNKLVGAFDGMVGRVYERAKVVEDNTGLGPCYYSNGVVLGVPSLVLRFAGRGSSVVLPRRNYFYEFMDESDDAKKMGSRKVGCLMLINGGDEGELKGGPGATLGNYQQQGFEVVYDLEEKRVGFARRHCASLWDSLKNRT